MPFFRPQERYPGRQQIEEEPRVCVEAMIEVARLDHRYDILDIHALVGVEGLS